MHVIYLLNRKQLVNDYARIQFGDTIFGSLLFVKKYHEIIPCLSLTPLIQDICNIIMTYVNDKFEVKYIIQRNSNLENYVNIEYHIDCIICFQRYIFPFHQIRSTSIANVYTTFVSINNNIFSSNIGEAQHPFQNVKENTLYERAFDTFFQTFVEEYGSTFPDINRVIYELRFIKKSCHEYITMKGLHHINIVNVKKMRNICVIIKLINRALFTSCDEVL